MKNSFTIAMFFLLTLCGVTQAQTPASPVPPSGLSNHQTLLVNMTLSEGNKISFTAHGKYSAMYGSMLAQRAIEENENKQMRRFAHETQTTKLNSATQIRLAEIAAQPVVHIAQSIGTKCGNCHCSNGKIVRVYRAWSSIHRAYRYRITCPTTHALIYDAYMPPSGITWLQGFGPI